MIPFLFALMVEDRIKRPERHKVRQSNQNKIIERAYVNIVRKNNTPKMKITKYAGSWTAFRIVAHLAIDKGSQQPRMLFIKKTTVKAAVTRQ